MSKFKNGDILQFSIGHGPVCRVIDCNSTEVYPNSYLVEYFYYDNLGYVTRYFGRYYKKDVEDWQIADKEHTAVFEKLALERQLCEIIEK